MTENHAQKSGKLSDGDDNYTNGWVANYPTQHAIFLRNFLARHDPIDCFEKVV